MIRAKLKIESWHSSAAKARFKIVRADSCADVPGKIVTADEESGECLLSVDGEQKQLNFGPNGMRIISR